MASLTKLIFRNINIWTLCLFIPSFALAQGDEGSESADTKPIPAHWIDKPNFTPGAQVKVYLNYMSFKTEGLIAQNPEFTQANLEAAIRFCIDRWLQVTGMNLNVRYAGTTTKTEAGDKEIIIRAASYLGRQALASATNVGAGFSMNRSNITFYLKLSYNSNNDMDWIVFSDDELYTNSFTGTLMHEMGHSFGLGHNNNDNNKRLRYFSSVMNTSKSGIKNHGPFEEDVDDIIAMYGYRPRLDLDLLASSNSGKSWKELRYSNIDKANIRTTQPVSLSLDDDKRMMLFYTSMDKRPAVISANADPQFGLVWTFDLKGRKIFNGERSLYGTSGHGYDNEYMMAWVSSTSSKPDKYSKVQLRRSLDGGKRWATLNLPEKNDKFTHASGTPAVHKIKANTWIVVYPTLNQSDYSDTNSAGDIAYHISTNDGKTWGAQSKFPKKYRRHLKTFGGVTVTSRGNKIRIGFAAANPKEKRAGTITTILAKFNRKNKLVFDSYSSYNKIPVRTEPSFTADKNKFVMGYRNRRGQLYSRNSYFSSPTSWWGRKKRVDRSYHVVPPSVGASGESSSSYMIRIEKHEPTPSCIGQVRVCGNLLVRDVCDCP